MGYVTNFDDFLPKFYVGLLPLTGLFSYFFFNIGLQYYDSIYMAPLIKIIGMIHKLLSGCIYLDEFNKNEYTPIRLIFFIMGIMICILGIMMLIFGNYTNSINKIKQQN